MTRGLGWTFALLVSSIETLSEEEKELIREIKRKGIPCDIIYTYPYSEPVMLYRARPIQGYEEIKRFINNWEKVWKPEYEQLVKEAEERRRKER
jgi:hypothetical protein